MPLYKLSSSADRDFEQIFEYGIDQFGVDVAIKYQNALKQRFNELGQKPLAYPAIDDVRIGYRKSVCGVHSIYYQIQDNGVEIIRILGRQDAERQLK